jgi:ABC-type xylose transport system permease subunit
VVRVHDRPLGSRRYGTTGIGSGVCPAAGTRYGRHIFAVGGNAEAAWRAGIRINRVKVSVFALASTLAAAE